MLGARLTPEHVARFARLAIAGIPREFPNKPSNVITGPEAILGPRQMHPVFYGCFDWHSSVHGHWMLVRLLRMSPAAPTASEARALLNCQLTAEGLAAEAAYFDERENRGFERMYGWAWALRLAAELRAWDDADARRWARNLRPLEEKLVALSADYLPRLSYPIRCGVHANTAFALSHLLDYARQAADSRQAADEELEHLVVGYCLDKYGSDRDCPVGYEPSGEDFLSPAWAEADLMRRVLDREAFAEWLTGFLPAIENGGAAAAMTPAEVSDLLDPRLVHLVGLNLSRAWCQRGVLHALPDSDPRRPRIQASAEAHAQAGLADVFTGDYAGEHWLATFAVYLLSGAGLSSPASTA